MDLEKILFNIILDIKMHTIDIVSQNMASI